MRARDVLECIPALTGLGAVAQLIAGSLHALASIEDPAWISGKSTCELLATVCDSRICTLLESICRVLYRKLEYSDWKQLYEKFGVSVFVTAPLVAPDGVLGSLCVAGGTGCAGKPVKGGVGGVHASNIRLIAELLAESLLRRTAEMLLDVNL